MKRALYLLLPLALLSGGCTRDEIEVSGSSGSGTTTRTDTELALNAESFEAILGAGNTYPTLSNPYGVSVTYHSCRKAFMKQYTRFSGLIRFRAMPMIRRGSTASAMPDSISGSLFQRIS